MNCIYTLDLKYNTGDIHKLDVMLQGGFSQRSWIVGRE